MPRVEFIEIEIPPDEPTTTHADPVDSEIERLNAHLKDLDRQEQEAARTLWQYNDYKYLCEKTRIAGERRTTHHRIRELQQSRPSDDYVRSGQSFYGSNG